MTDPLTVLLDEADARYGGHISTHYEGCYLDHVGCFAVAVRDVFEQAHAPTDDEREARQALDILHRYAFGSNEIGREQVSNMVEIISDHFRRTAVPEPAEPQDEHPCGDWPAPCNCNDPETHDQSEPQGVAR